MNLAGALAATTFGFFCLVAGAAGFLTWLIERRNPPVGSFAEVNGTRLHYVHVPARTSTDLPALVFMHGASGNLKDQMIPLRPLLEGRAEMVFLDRPGHGWSTRGIHNENPYGQSETISALMTHLGLSDAIIIGHSFGGAVAAAFALRHPGKTRGLLFLAPATHPWPGARTAWHYRLAARPVLGRIFSATLAGPAGLLRMSAATKCVFAPNPLPPAYSRAASIELVLRPASFRANAVDVEGLFRHVTEAAPRYREITAPSIIITGDSDTVVYEEIHSLGLARDIRDAELVWVRNLGHKPDWIAPDLVVRAIEKLAGTPADLQALAGEVEGRISPRSGQVGSCVDEPAPAQ